MSVSVTVRPAVRTFWPAANSSKYIPRWAGGRGMCWLLELKVSVPAERHMLGWVHSQYLAAASNSPPHFLFSPLPSTSPPSAVHRQDRGRGGRGVRSVPRATRPDFSI